MNECPQKGTVLKGMWSSNHHFLRGVLCQIGTGRCSKPWGPRCEPAFFSREWLGRFDHLKKGWENVMLLLQRSMASLEISCNICILQVEPLKNCKTCAPWKVELGRRWFFRPFEGQTFIEGASWVRWWKLCKKIMTTTSSPSRIQMTGPFEKKQKSTSIGYNPSLKC